MQVAHDGKGRLLFLAFAHGRQCWLFLQLEPWSFERLATGSYTTWLCEDTHEVQEGGTRVMRLNQRNPKERGNLICSNSG